MKKTTKKIIIARINGSGKKRTSAIADTKASGKPENKKPKTDPAFKTITEKTFPEMDLILNNTEESFVFVGTDFRIILFNQEFQKLYTKYFGKKVRKGESILHYTQSAREEIVKKIYLRVFNGETLESEIEAPFSDQSVHTFFNRFKPAHDEDGNVTGAFVSITDITESKKTEKLLKEERLLLRTLIDNLPINVYTKDLQSRKTLANRTDYEYTGFTNEEDVLGKDDYELFSEESAINTIAEDKLIFRTGESIIGKEEHHIKKDGSDIWFLISKIPLRNEKNGISGLLGISYNITERKQMEEKIRIAKERYDIVVKATNEAIWDWDILNNNLHWGEGFRSLFGYDPEKEVVTLESWTSHIYPEDMQRVIDSIMRVVRSTGDSRWEEEYRFMKADGSYANVLDRGFAIRDAEGKAIRMIGATLDITQRKKVEEELAKSERGLKKAQEISHIGNWEADLINNTGSWSDETCRIFGYELGEVPPTIESYLATVHPGDIDFVTKNIEESNKSFKPSSFTHRVIRKDGSVRTIYTESRYILNKENKPARVYGIHHDITEIKKAEEALKENKASLQKAFDIAVIGSWKYDIRNDRYEWTQSAIDVIGFRKEDVPDNWDSYQKFIPAEDIPLFHQEIEKAHHSGVFDVEHRVNIYSKIKWIRAKSHLEYDEKGTPVASIGIIQDITERKLIEQQLTDAYNFNQTIIETSPVGIWIYNESGQTISANGAAIELSGADAEKLLNLNFREIPSWKEAGLYDAAIEAMESEKPVRKEIHFINTFNKELWFEALLAPVQFKGKKHLILMTYDIQDRMKAEESMRKSEKQLSLAMQIARLGYWEFDVAEGLFTFNDQFYTMLKTTAGEAGGYRLTPERYTGLFVHPDDQAIVGNEVEKAITTTDPDFSRQIEHRVIFGNGETGYVSVNFYIIKDDKGNTIKTYGVSQDITERKKAEEEIRLSKERYELVARATNDAIYEWDMINNVNYWGEGYETLFGHKRPGDKMHTDTWIENLHPDEKEQLFAAIYNAFAKKLPSLTRELRFKCADGSYKTVFDKLMILYDNNGNPVKTVGAMQDITERKKNELAIEELNTQLKKRAAELAASNAELERFAYVASHDLQEPLRMVSSFLQLLQRKYDAQLDETATQYIGYAVDGADRMKKLILDLLEYSRIGTNKDTLTDTNISEVVNQVLGTFAGKIEESGTHIKMQMMPVIKVNRTQMVQLFQNLIGNALKYNTSAIPEVEIGCEEKENVWQFFVKDNGIGIDQKFFDKVFIIFQRLHNKNQFSGTGIGLAICKKIIERHGGTIWIESSVGAGSTFFFTIKK